MRYTESRFERRRLKRAENEQQREARKEQKLLEKMYKQEPRTGDDRRVKERRSTAMTPAEVDDWLKRNGISSGDRRKGQRRQGDRRR